MSDLTVLENPQNNIDPVADYYNPQYVKGI